MKFIHTADVHLGAVPDPDCPWSASREKEIWQTFRRIIRLAGEERADLLLIAGDLFHRQPLVRELREVGELFSMIPDTQIVWMAGNHDYMKPDSAYRRVGWGANVHGFFSETPAVIHLPSIRTWVYGLSYEHREIRENPYRGLRPGKEPGYHILLAHGGDAAHIPFGREDGAAFDYAALGHIHKPGVLIPDRMAYAGAPEPIDRNDVGRHGVICGRMDRADGETRTKIRFCPLAVRSYLQLEFEVHSGTTQTGLEREVSEAVARQGSENLYRLRLTGYRNPDMEFDREALAGLGNIVEVSDESRPCYDLNRLKAEWAGTLVGEYIRRLEGQGGEEGKKALYYGLQALLEQE